MSRRAERIPMGRASIVVLALFLALVLALPEGQSHIPGARPYLQRSERDRIVGLSADSLAVRADLSQSGEPLREFVSHEIDPTNGLYFVRHRPDESRPQEQFYAQWQFTRLVEFRDQNVNGLFEPDTDTAIKAWRFTHYQWNRSLIAQAKVADVTANDVSWNGTLTGGPKLRVEVAIAGHDFADEGATVRPQDIIVYWDLTNFTPHDFGTLYALEATITVPKDAKLSFFQAQNVSTALLADEPSRRALLVWGGTGLVDGAEQNLNATLTEERVTDDGNRTATLTLNIPVTDKSMRFVLVSGVEYVAADLRAPMLSPIGVAGVFMVLALTRRAYRHGRAD